MHIVVEALQYDVRVYYIQLDYAEIVLRTIREAETASAAVGDTDVAVSLSDCNKLIERYAKLALDFSAANHCNEPGK